MLAHLELLGATVAYAAGNLLQAVAAERSRLVDRPALGLLRQLARDRLYVLGFACQVVGFGLAFLSRATLPLYLAQMSTNAAVALTALVGAVLLGWRLGVAEVLAVLGTSAGLVLLAASTLPSQAAPLSPSGATAMVGVLAIAVGLGALAGRVHGARGAVVLGGCAGLAFGVLAVIGRPLAAGPLWLVAIRPSFWLMVLAAIAGQAMFAAGLQRGSTTGAVASMAAVSTLLASGSGWWLLGDRVAPGRVPWLLTGLGLVICGVWGLAAAIRVHHVPAEVARVNGVWERDLR